MSTYEPTTKDNKCIFCEIVAGRFETPGIYWQDEEFMAFLSIDPNTIGFSCVIPKMHYDSDVMKMPDDMLQKFILASKKVVHILEDYFKDVGRVGVIMEGTSINHAHIKLVPMHNTEYLKTGEWHQTPSGKELYFEKYEGWIASCGGPMADMGELKILAESIIESQK